MARLPYFLYDVFTSAPFGGGPLAVVDVRENEPLSDELMQKIAREFSLPETTFIYPPQNPQHLAQIRIFTMTQELPMAGHPTIGTSLHLFTNSADIDTNFIVELGVGPTSIEIEQGDSNRAFMLQQPARFTAAESINLDDLAQALSVSTEEFGTQPGPEFVSAGLSFLIVPVNSKEDLFSIEPNQKELSELLASQPSGFIYAFAFDENNPNKIHARMFNSDVGDHVEDPATGSAAGSLTHYLDKYWPEKLADNNALIIHQGQTIGRPSEIIISMAQNAEGLPVPRVGGSACAIGYGFLTI